MRNLSVSTHSATRIPDATVSATALDTYEGLLFVASELSNPDGEVTITIWKIDQKNDAKNSEASLLTSFTSVASTASLPQSLQIVSLRFIAETRQLVVILLGGDITVVVPYDDDITCEVEGTFDKGILAASWCPDESLLVLVTGDSKLILMTVTFDILSEAPLHTTDFGEDVPINVGWGSKQTQFHGSLGKAAAQQPSNTKVAFSPDDDTLPRISWRGDGSLFAVSALSPLDSAHTRRRAVRVYDRMASLQSTSEPVPGLEHPLAWRPSGNLIAGTQRFGFEGGGAGVEGRHDVVFFEKNGLQHGQFGLRPKEILLNVERPAVSGNQWGYRVRELSWSAESSILCVWIERDEDDIVQLWTTGNYHWYLKQELVATQVSVEHSNRFTSVGWHPEQPMHLMLTTASTIIQRTFAWDYYASRAKPPHDSGTVCVIDGSTLLLTSFRTQNVPPPMCSHRLSLLSPDRSTPGKRMDQTVWTPIHASLSPSADVIGLLWECGRIELWDLRTRLGPGSGKVMDPIKLRECHLQDNNRQLFRQINVLMTEQLEQSKFNCCVVVLGSSNGQDMLAVAEFQSEDNLKIHWITLPKCNGRLVSSSEGVNWQAYDGEVYDINVRVSEANSVARFPEFCFTSTRLSISPPNSESGLVSYIGFGDSGRLHLTVGKSNHVLATHTTSFVVTNEFCIFTTTSQEAVFAPLASLTPFAANANDEELQKIISSWEVRRIERGSRIVTSVPSTMSLVLQMPRGNLETINPRPLVMSAVKQDLDMGNYRQAFLACRKHRIDLNTLVDHNRPAFLKNLSSFVEQIGEVDYINIFLTTVGHASQPPEVIAELCDAFRVELEAKDLTKYIKCILTAYVVKSPPDHESGLELLLRLRETDSHLVEDAVKYIIFLVDADTLFNAALGMYDFSLVLMVAQHAQKDPREYLPFLRELRAMEKYYQRFKIDEHLKRHERALKNLSLAGDEHFEEAMEYIETYRLHGQAISIWKGTDRYLDVLGVYGDRLLECRQFREAALTFTEANRLDKAMFAHERALEWRQLFDLAIREGVPEEEIITIGYRVAEDLSAKKRHSEGARVLLDYSKDVREAVITLVQGNEFSEARRIVTLLGEHELLTDIIHPASFESRAQIEEDMGEMREQLQKQLHRLRELRLKKIEEPEIFFGTEDNENLHVDVMTDVSMAGTAFTRYTAAPSAASKTSKRSSRSKRKMMLKAESGKKGTVYEEEYLFKSIAKLVDRFNNTQDEANRLLPHLLQFTLEHRREAKGLQDSIQSFWNELQVAIDEIWQRSPQAPPITSIVTANPAPSLQGSIEPSISVGQPILNDLSWAMLLSCDVDP